METLCSSAQEHTALKAAAKVFTEQCKSIEEDLADEESLAVDGLTKFLGLHPSAKLKDGRYLSMHRTVSPLALNEDRVETALGKVDEAALLRQKTPSELDSIVAAIEEALRAECTRVSHAPRILKNAPKGLPKGKYTVKAPDAVEEMCAQLGDAKDNLKKIRARKGVGKQQVAPTLEASRKRVHEAMNTLFPVVDAEPVMLKLEPEPDVQVEGQTVDLPELPMGDVPVMNKKKKRKTVTVPGLEASIKVRRKIDKPKTKKPKVTIETFADEMSFLVRERYGTTAQFLKLKNDVTCDALELLTRLSIPEESQSAGPGTYSITIS